jgi:hypothetical protein
VLALVPLVVVRICGCCCGDSLSSVGVRSLADWPTSGVSEPGIGMDVSWTPLFPPTITLAVVGDRQGEYLTSLEISADATPYVLAFGTQSDLGWWIVGEPFLGLWRSSASGDSGMMVGFRTGLALHVFDTPNVDMLIVEYGWHTYFTDGEVAFRSACLRTSVLWEW